MINILRSIITERLNAYKQERDELLKIAKLPLVTVAGQVPAYSPEIRRLIAYVDAYTDILNRLDAKVVDIADVGPTMTEGEKQLAMLNSFLGEISPENWVTEILDRSNPEMVDRLTTVVSCLTFCPTNFPAMLYLWYMNKFHPPTPKFDVPMEPIDTPPSPPSAPDAA